MIRAIFRRGFVVWLMLAVAAMWVIRPTARADGPPCNCGNGQPCVANQMYFGYYPTVWRQWPGTNVAPHPAASQQPGQQLPLLELPKPDKEFESKPSGSASESSGANSTSSGADMKAPGQPTGQNPPEGRGNPPGPGNSGVPAPAPNTPQNLNRLMAPTDPQAYYPPVNVVRPAFSQINVRPSPAGVWPPSNELRASQLKAQYQISDDLLAPQFKPLTRPAPARNAPYFSAPAAGNQSGPLSVMPPGARPTGADSPAGPFAVSVLSSSAYAKPMIPLASPVMINAAAASLAVKPSSEPLLPTGPLATLTGPSDAVAGGPQSLTVYPMQYEPRNVVTNQLANDFAPAKSAAVDPKAPPKIGSLSENHRGLSTSAESAEQKGTAPRSTAEAGDIASGSWPATKSAAASADVSAAAPPQPKPTTTDLFAASPLSTAVLASASVPRPYGTIPALPMQRSQRVSPPAVALATSRPATVGVQAAPVASVEHRAAADQSLPEDRATTAVTINRSAPWISLPHAERDDILDLRGLTIAPTLAANSPQRPDLQRSASLQVQAAPPRLPGPPAAPQITTSVSDYPNHGGSAAPTGAAAAWAHDQNPIPAGTATFIPTQLPAPSARSGEQMRTAIYQQPVPGGFPASATAPYGAAPHAATAIASDAPKLPVNQLRPAPAGQANGPTGGTWAVAADQSGLSNNRPAARIWAIDPRAIESSLGADKQPAASRLPIDNALAKGQFQVADDVTLGGPQPASHDPRSALPIRQADFQVAQPTGEQVGLSAVDPLAVSRSLAAPAFVGTPPRPFSPPGAPIGLPPTNLPFAPRPSFAPPAGMARASDAGAAPLFAPPAGMARASDAGTARAFAPPAVRPASSGMAFASDAANSAPPRGPMPGMYAPSQRTSNPSDANPLRGVNNAAGPRGGDFSAPDWSQMPDSVIGSANQNPLR